jgi:dihydrofolate reductase
MEISLIAAKGKYNEIGYQNKLIWHIKEDFEWFQWQTFNKPVVMGRSTYESIGKPLKHRINVVLSRDKNYNPDPRVLVLSSVDEVIYEFRKYKELMIIGGENVYKQFMPYANRLYLTEVDEAFVADTFFPEFPLEDYRECYSRKGVEDTGFEYHFKVYRKKLKD